MNARALAGAAAVAAGAGVAVWGAWIEPRRLVVREVELVLPHWPRALDGMRAGVVSDLHSGVPHVGLETIDRAVAALNDARPDAHWLLGDYLDASQVWRKRLAPERIAESLARLRSPQGTLAVIGNHDWHNSGDHMWRALEQAGIPVLEDQATKLANGAWVAGLADLRHRRPSVSRALHDVPPAEPVVVLSHDPDMFTEIPERVSLTLSGHTHGGQVAVPILRRPMMPSRHGERFARGHIVEHGRHLYVTSGIGTSGIPVRLFAPPEVVVVTLRSAA